MFLVAFHSMKGYRKAKKLINISRKNQKFKF